jgi:hypothetical protein
VEFGICHSLDELGAWRVANVKSTPLVAPKIKRAMPRACDAVTGATMAL